MIQYVPCNVTRQEARRERGSGSARSEGEACGGTWAETPLNYATREDGAGKGDSISVQNADAAMPDRHHPPSHHAKQ